jgi:hypothetical protein
MIHTAHLHLNLLRISSWAGLSSDGQFMSSAVVRHVAYRKACPSRWSGSRFSCASGQPEQRKCGSRGNVEGPHAPDASAPARVPSGTQRRRRFHA